MRCDYACGAAEHLMHRRKFLGSAALGLGGVVAGLGAFARPALARTLDVNPASPNVATSIAKQTEAAYVA